MVGLAHRKYQCTLLLLLLLFCNVLFPFVPISTLRLVFLLLDSSADGGLVDGLLVKFETTDFALRTPRESDFGKVNFGIL